MFAPHQYQLIDFGQGYKLEDWGGMRVCRQTPSATGPPESPLPWPADLSFRRPPGGGWDRESPPGWGVAFEPGELKFELKSVPTGQIGLFPEQASNWEWILSYPRSLESLSALNLFGYTGGTTLALARRGVQVTHVDAAPSVVRWARRNAELSGLAEAPIRWIVEDALKFLKREQRRGNRYDILIADPPSFGRGPKGQTWKFERDLDELLAGLAQLTDGDPELAVISCHTPGFDAHSLAARLNHGWPTDSGSLGRGSSWQPHPLRLVTASGRTLAAGHAARWSAESHHSHDGVEAVDAG